jgi:hypothetical protein
VKRILGEGLVPVLKRPEIFHNSILRQRASAAFPEAVAIAVLRDPVERSVSAWWHYRRLGVIDPGMRLRDCVSIWERSGNASPAGPIIGYSLYAQAALGLARSFATISVVFSDDVARDPGQAFQPVIEWLELDEGATALPRLNTRIGVAKKASSLPPRLVGRLTYRWDAKEQHMTPRAVGWRVAALARMAAPAIERSRPAPEVEVTDEDRTAVFAAVCADLKLLEQYLVRPVPGSWHRL